MLRKRSIDGLQDEHTIIINMKAMGENWLIIGYLLIINKELEEVALCNVTSKVD